MAKKQAVNGERGRWSATAKREAVLRLLLGPCPSQRVARPQPFSMDLTSGPAVQNR